MVFFLACCCPRRRTRRHFRHRGSPPTYDLVIRSQCRLLTAVWEQEWDTVRDLCRSHPEEAFCRSQNNFRTALHLATMPGVRCPVWILQILIETNPHAVLMQDSHMFGGTPVHFVCGSSYRNNPRVIQLFVDTAIQMEQQYEDTDMRRSGWSPLFLAARRAAPVETIEILVQSRRHTGWIAPWTGGETIEYIKSSWTIPDNESPLQTLWTQTEFPTRLTTDLKCQMKEVARVLMDDQSPPTTMVDLTVTRWMQCLLLLREHCKSSTAIIHHVACLYQPIPELLQLVCDLYPELLMSKNNKGRIPLHEVLYHQRRTEMLRTLVGILVQAEPESLAVVELSELYPCFLAAAQDASLDTIFYMLTMYPQVLELQRQSQPI